MITPILYLLLVSCTCPLPVTQIDSVPVVVSPSNITSLSEMLVDVHDEYLSNYTLLDKIPEWTQIIENISLSREYEFGVWDCSNMSESSVKKLIVEGYDAWYCIGYFCLEEYREDSLHAWVVIRLNDTVIRLDPSVYPHTRGIPDEYYVMNYESVGCYNDRFPDWIPYKT